MDEPPTTFELLEPPAAGPLLPDHGLWLWFAGAAALIVLLLGALLLVSLLRRKHPGDATSLRAAAYRDAVAALAGIPAEDAREAAVRCSLILRRYLATAASDPALFETHEEFVSRHDALQNLGEDARTAAGEGFRKLAAVKYSPDNPSLPAGEIVTGSRALLETLHQGLAA